MELDRMLIQGNPALSVSGIDVVDSHPQLGKHMTFGVYDGARLPYAEKTFDAAIVYHVFHHCRDPLASLGEVKRVVKKRILVVEAVLRSYAELPFFMMADLVANRGREAHIPMPFEAKTDAWWKKAFDRLQLRIIIEKPAGFLPSWLPIGTTKLYILAP